MNNALGGCGIEVLSHDEGTFLVQSRTNREDYHIIEFVYEWIENPETGGAERHYTGEITCSCEGYQFRHKAIDGYECWHIQYVKRIVGIASKITTENSQLERAA